MKDDLGNEYFDPSDVVVPFCELGESVDYGKCHYCGDKLTKATKTRDHFRPRLGGKVLIKRNTVKCCRTCNIMKASLQPEQFFSKIEKIYKNPNFGKLLNYASSQKTKNTDSN